MKDGLYLSFFCLCLQKCLFIIGLKKYKNQWETIDYQKNIFVILLYAQKCSVEFVGKV